MYNKPHMFANTQHCWQHYVTEPDPPSASVSNFSFLLKLKKKLVVY